MSETESSPASEHPVASRRFAVLSIMLTTALFFGAISVIAYQWIVRPEPRAEFLIIDGSVALAGAEADVQSVDLPTHFKAIFGADGRYSLVFFLDPGAYNVRITRDGHNLIQPQEVAIPRRHGFRIDLSKWGDALATTRTAEP
jgi:hypothetical protein